ncbi:hypothetical protein ACVWWK_002587 [Bradyrhizobium sp. LB9.1b]
MRDGQATGPTLGPIAPNDTVRPLAVRNKLLRCIPEPELAVLHSIGTDVELRPHQVLHHWRLPMEHVFFLGKRPCIGFREG